MNRVDLAACPAQPWRNGGGVTRELLAWPAAADWLLRVSVAEVARSRAFSAYPGVERWFAVIDGAGLRLALPAGAVTLVPGSAPLRFDGAHAPECSLLDGPTHDLNFMVRQGVGRAAMRPAAHGSGRAPGLRWQGLFAADEGLVRIDGSEQTLGAGTLLWADGTWGSSWHWVAGGRAWWLTLEST